MFDKAGWSDLLKGMGTETAVGFSCHHAENGGREQVEMEDLPPSFCDPSILQSRPEGDMLGEMVPNTATDQLMLHGQLAPSDDSLSVPTQHEVLNSADIHKDGDGDSLALSDSYSKEGADKRLGESDGMDFDGGGEAPSLC